VWEEESLPNVSVEKKGKGVQEFVTSYPLPSYGAYMELRGRVEGNSMKIAYQDHGWSGERGEIELTRIRKQPTPAQ
jgi:hypothetical protein